MPGFLLLLGIGFVLALGAETLLIAHRLRRPSRRTYAAALARGIAPDPSEADPPRSYRAFTFDARARSGRSTSPRSAWEIEGDNPGGPMVVCCPGWGDSKVGVIPRLAALAPVASAIIAWDPAGLGESAGRCGLGSRSDVLELCALVESQGRKDVVLYGWSMGAGVAIAAAAELARRGGVVPSAVIAEAPYRMPQTPARGVLRSAGLPHRLSLPIAFGLLGLRLGEGLRWRGFDRAGLARNLRCPLLVLHGDADEICPPEEGREIAGAAPCSRLVLIPGANHNNIWAEPPYAGLAAGAIREFLAPIFPIPD